MQQRASELVSVMAVVFSDDVYLPSGLVSDVSFLGSVDDVVVFCSQFSFSCLDNPSVQLRLRTGRSALRRALPLRSKGAPRIRCSPCCLCSLCCVCLNAEGGTR